MPWLKVLKNPVKIVAYVATEIFDLEVRRMDILKSRMMIKAVVEIKNTLVPKTINNMPPTNNPNILAKLPILLA